MELKLQNVCYNDIHNNIILKNINLNIKEGSIIGVMGKDGCGKTSLFEFINHLILPNSGNIFINGQIIDEDNLFIFKKKIGMVYQEPDKHFLTKNVIQEFETRLLNCRGDKTKRMIDSLKMMGLNQDILNLPISKLSASQKRKLSFALVLSYNPDLIILDEPLLNIDHNGREQISKLIKMMKNRYNKTILIVSNDSDLLLDVTSDICIMDKGEIIYYNDKYKVFGNTSLLKKYDIAVPKIIEVSNIIKDKKNIDIGYRDDINDLIKDIYRYAERK